MSIESLLPAVSDHQIDSLARGDIGTLPLSDLLPLAQDGSFSPESIAACLVLSTRAVVGVWKLQAGNKFLRRNGRDGMDLEDARVLLEDSISDPSVAKLGVFGVLCSNLAFVYDNRTYGDAKENAKKSLDFASLASEARLVRKGS